MPKQILITLLVLATPSAALAAPAPAWRVQQACALQRYLGATPAFASNWGQNASAVSLGGGGMTLRRREDPEARARFDASMRSGRAFADRAAALLAERDKITEDEAIRRIGADPGPWPLVTHDRCESLEKRAARTR